MNSSMKMIARLCKFAAYSMGEDWKQANVPFKEGEIRLPDPKMMHHNLALAV